MANMPVIPADTAGRVGIPESKAATAVDFGASSALPEASSALNTAASSINRALEQEDSSTAARMLAETRAKWSIRLQEDMKFAESQLFNPVVPPNTGGPASGPTDITADPVGVKQPPAQQFAYRDMATKYANDLNDEILSLRGTMRTRGGIERYDNMMANLRGDLTTRAFEAQAELVGRKAVVDFQSMVDSNANTLMADPTHLSSILTETAQTFRDMSNIPAGMRDKLWNDTENTLAFAAGRGLIDANPMLALQTFRGGAFDNLIKPEQKQQLIGESITEMKAVEVMAEKLRKQQAAQLVAQREVTNNDFLDKFQQGKLTWNDVKNSNLEAMGEGSKNFWLGKLEQQAREGEKPVRTDPQLYWELTKRINLPPGDPKKITNQDQLLAYHDRVSISDLKDLRNQAVQARGEDGSKLGTDTNRFLEGMRAQFIKAPVGLPDPQGEEAFYKFNFALREEMERYREANKDPRELLNPESPAYFGKQVKLYSPSQADRIKSLTESAREEFRQGKPGAPDTGSLPTVPNDPGARVRGMGYQSPTGPVTWTGTGWLRGLWRWDDGSKKWVPQ